MLPIKKETKELTEQQEQFLEALFGEAKGNPKQAGEIAGYDGTTPGANIRMEAAKQILDRVGLVKREKVDINAKVAHGIFILPPKDELNKA